MENSRDSIVLAADLPDLPEIEHRDGNRASELASRFHQLVSECVYAYGGVVQETTGSMVLAELPEPDKALQCIEGLQRRISAENSSGSALAPRAVLTAGEVHDLNFSIAGQAVQNALSILDSLAANQIVISSAVLSGAGVTAGGDPLLSLGEARYFALPISAVHSPLPRPVTTTPAAVPVPPDENPVGEPPGEAGDAALRKPWLIAALAMAALLVSAAVAFVMVRQERETSPVSEVEAPVGSSQEASGRIALSIAGLDVGADVESEAVPDALATALMAALLSSSEQVEIEPIAPDRVGADIRMIVPERVEEAVDETPVAAAAQPGPVPGSPSSPAEARVVPWIERSGERFEGPSSELGDVWSIVIPSVRWAGEQLPLDTEVIIPQSTRLREAFAALVEKSASRASDAEIAALHAALEQEPRFLPGWLVLSRVETDDRRLAPLILDGLRNASRMMPARQDLARELGRRELEEGILVGAVEAFARVKTENPEDEEATRILALAALAAHQPERFEKLAEESRDPRLHPADVQVTEGGINEAVKRYYESQAQDADNPHLSFKVGRIAVLRRSSQIAQIEIDRLTSQGAEPQRSFLRAYIAADEGNKSDAEEALAAALDRSEWPDSPSFHAAEVHAILRDAPRALAAIERSVERREPMMHAVATNPLFGYLTGEPRFREAVRQILQHQSAIGASLANHLET